MAPKKHNKHHHHHLKLGGVFKHGKHGKNGGKKKGHRKHHHFGGFKDMLKKAGHKLEDKVKQKGASLEAKMKKKKEEMREKMKAKGNDLRKKMKAKMHEMHSDEFKEKMRQKGHDLKEKMRERGHELKAQMRERGHELKAKMRERGHEMKALMHAKGHEFKEDMKKKMKAAGEDWEKKMAVAKTGVAKNVLTMMAGWRTTFEEQGWAYGEAATDWATFMLMGLNLFCLFMGIPVLTMTSRLATKLKSECLNVLLGRVMVIGFLFSITLMLVSIAGFVGVWFNRLDFVKFQFFITSSLLLMLFSITVIGFMVTYRGGGKRVKGIKFKMYKVTDYSKYFQRKVNGTKWEKMKECVSFKGFCDNWPYTFAEDVYAAKLSPIQVGCCMPPLECGYAYRGGTNWQLPSNPDATPDCGIFNENQARLCLDCSTCKAGVLQNVRSHYLSFSLVSIVIIAVLCTILYRTWFVMRVSGRWDPVLKTVKKVVNPEKVEEKEEEIGVIVDLHEEEHHDEPEHHEEEHHEEPKKEEDEDVLVPAWLEENIPEDQIPKSSTSSEQSVGPKKKPKQKGKGQRPPGTKKGPQRGKGGQGRPPQARQKAQIQDVLPLPDQETHEDAHEETAKVEKGKAVVEEHEEEPAVKVSKGKAPVEEEEDETVKGEKGGKDEDDSWASPRLQMQPAMGMFPQGFLAQNPLTTSPWVMMQSPDAGYIQDDPNYLQAYYQNQDYMQAYYQADPYGQQQQITGFDQQQMMGYDQYGNYQYDQGFDPQMYGQDPQMQIYGQDPQMQMYGQDPQMQMYGQDSEMQMYGQDMYGQIYGQDPQMQMYAQDPAYMQAQGYNYTQDPNQVYNYTQDPNQAYNYTQQNTNQAYMQNPGY